VKNRPGGERGVQVFAGVGIVRLESQGFLVLADRSPARPCCRKWRPGCCGLRRSRASRSGPAGSGDGLRKTPFRPARWPVILCVGVIRFQTEGFLVLADRPVNLALLAEGATEVVVGVGVIRFQARASWYWLMASSTRPFRAEGVAEGLCAR